MNKKEQLEQIEKNIDYFLQSYDFAKSQGREDIVKKACNCIENELSKLKKLGMNDEIKITTELQ